MKNTTVTISLLAVAWNTASYYWWAATPSTASAFLSYSPSPQTARLLPQLPLSVPRQRTTRTTIPSTTRVISSVAAACFSDGTETTTTATTARGDGRDLQQKTTAANRHKNQISSIANNNKNSQQQQQQESQAVKKILASAALCGAILLSTLSASFSSSFSAHAYDSTDYASETVQTVIQALRAAGSDPDRTFQAYESIGDIITEGKGVGGAINYKGVQLERGYVADEDTSIYNPGLTLLTESEKERLVDAVIAARKSGLQQNTWNSNNQVAFEFLRGKLDPFHTYELRGYLTVVPLYSAVVYLTVFAVQQLARDLFPAAYFVGVAAIFGPAVVLILAGPQ